MKKNIIFSLAILLVAGMMSFANADVKVASGWSVANDEKAAISEAAGSVKKGAASPALVVLYCTSGYNQEALLKETKSQFPQAKIFGQNSYKTVFTQDGWHKGEKGSLAMLGIQTKDYIIGTAMVDLSQTVVDNKSYQLSIEKDKVEHMKAMAMKCIRDAVADAGKTAKDSPALVMISTDPGVEVYVTDAINKVFGKTVDVMGGTSCNDAWTGGSVISKDGVFAQGIVVAVIYTKNKIGTAFHGGFIGQSASGIATEVDSVKNIIYKIDGKPAFDVYNAWGKGFLGSRPTADGVNIIPQAHTKPLAIVLKDESGDQQFVTVIPLSANKDGSMSVAARIMKNDKVMLVGGGADVLINRTGSSAKNAIVNGGMKKSEVAGGLHIYCNGAAYVGIAVAKGEDHIGDIVDPINKSLGGAPFIGAFSGGEQGNYKGCGAFHGNFMSAMTLFSSK